METIEQVLKIAKVFFKNCYKYTSNDGNTYLRAHSIGDPSKYDFILFVFNDKIEKFNNSCFITTSSIDNYIPFEKGNNSPMV